MISFSLLILLFFSVTMASPMSRELSMNEVEVCLADIESWPSQQAGEASEANYMTLLQQHLHLSNGGMINRSVSPASEFDSVNYYTDVCTCSLHLMSQANHVKSSRTTQHTMSTRVKIYLFLEVTLQGRP
jgi:hypothetical protein